MSLQYRPKWYLIGDAEGFGMAITYGVVALATLYQIESLAEQFLSPRSQSITLQDISCIITFKGSSWIEVTRWMFRRPSQKSISWKALKGIILRFVIILMDVGIIMASISREVDVYESQAGYTEMSFAESAVSILRDGPGGAVGLTCLADNIQYKSFSPTAQRQICMESLSSYPEKDPIDFLRPYADMFIIRKRNESLGIISARALIFYSITHSILYVNDTEKQETRRTARYKLPDDIVQQALSALSRDPILKEDCDFKPVNESDGTASFLCRPDKSMDLQLPNRIATYLFLNAGTRIVPKTELFLIGEDTKFKKFQGDIRVGFVNRPRLCIYPALIVFGILFACSSVSQLVWPECNLMASLYAWLSSAFDSSNAPNPIYTSKMMTTNLFDLPLPT